MRSWPSSPWSPTSRLPEDRYVIESVHGVTQSFVERGSYPLELKIDRFETDAEAWAAVIADPNLVVVSSRFDGERESIGNALLEPGDAVNLLNPETGEVIEKTVAARMESIEVNSGVLWGVVVGIDAYQRDFSDSSFRGDSPRLFTIKLTEGTDLAAGGKQIEKALVTTGARVIAVREELSEELSEISTFLRIFQGFLAFGLIVGIAGLAVIAARSIHQRRKGIGTLRALGFRPGWCWPAC